MKRAKKIIKKPEPAEESSGGSDSDETPTLSTKKAKLKRKRAVPPKPEESDGETTEQPKKVSKNTKGKGKKIPKLQEPVEESPDNSDAENALPEKPKQNPKNVKGKGKKPVKMKEPVKDSSHSSHSDIETTKKPKPTLKSAKGKKKNPVKIQEPVEELPQDSDSEDLDVAPSRTKNKGKGKGKNAKLSKPAEESSQMSDSEEEPSTSTNYKRKKVLVKQEVKVEPADSSDSEEEQSATTISKRKKVPINQGEEDVAKFHMIDSNIKGKKDLYTVPKPGETADNISDSELSSDMEAGSDALFKPQSLQRGIKHLQSIDPSFHAYLVEHDAQLLEFDEDDEGLDEKQGDDDFEKLHTPAELHGDSDESDFEDDGVAPIKGKVTLKMIQALELEFIKKEGKIKLSTIVDAVNLFSAAVRRATSADGYTQGEYKVAGSSVFNGIVNMCVLYLPWGMRKYLGMENSGVNPLRCKHFVKIKGTMVQYLNDLVKLLEVVTSDNILIVMLKHLHQISRFVACFTRIAKKIIKRILPLWSSGEETVRVLAFVCILRITRSQHTVLFNVVIKAMFMSYVRNSKFVSATTWPGINFMRRSLAELILLDLDAAYPQVFLYIRQLGIHMRNAIMVPTKDNKLAVYNWQFINSLHLWAVLLQQANNHDNLKSLQFPLSMLISNTIRLVDTPQYYPVRFHLIEILMEMSRESGLFIPIMGFLVDVLKKFDFNKKHKKVSMKPLDFTCMIRANKSQMSESGFKDAVVDRLYAVSLHYATTLSSTISFPDVMVILIVFLKDVVNKCTNPNHKRKLKQLLDKFEESSEYMRNLRFTYNLSYRNVNSIRGWEAHVRAEGTPLMTYFENWKRLNNVQKRRENRNDDPATAMPLITRKKIYDGAEVLFKDTIATTRPVTLFPSDSEDETDHFKDGDENKPPQIEKKVKKQKKQKKKTVKVNDENEGPYAADAGDVVQEFSASDW